jgi:YqaJ-like viral recombinase domain
MDAKSPSERMTLRNKRKPSTSPNEKISTVISPDKIEVFDCEQGSEAWAELRRGIPSASRFGVIMADGRDGAESITRRKLLYQLAGERLTGETAETFRSSAMERGNSMEAEAREAYARRRFAELNPVGFIKRTITNALGTDLIVGCSPDSLIGEDGTLEIKTMRPDLMIELAEKGAAGFPNQHRAQIQGTLWVSGRSWCDLFIYYRGMPITPTFRVERDAAYIGRLVDETERFEWEIRQLVEKIKRMGSP